MTLPCQPLRIAFYMHDLAGGGVERMRLALLSVLQSRGIEVTLILTAKRGKLVQTLPGSLRIIDLDDRRTLFATYKLAAHLRASRYDILVSSLDHNNIAAMLACRMSGSATRLVICQHNALSQEKEMGWKYRLVPLAYRLLHRTADGIVAVSCGVADDLAAAARITRQKISVIYNPIIDRNFYLRANGSPPHPWLAEKNYPTMIYAGRLTQQKDVFTLLAAMEMVIRQRTMRLIVVGEGEEEASLRRFANKAGIAHVIAFVGFQENPLPWIRHADALILSSRYEGLANVIVEALACATPVIATNCPHGPSELLLGGSLGRLVPVGDAVALAGAIVDFDKFQLDPSCLKARAARFSADACADAHLKLFNTIMHRRSNVVNALGMNLSPMRTEEVVETIIGETPSDCVDLVVTPNLDHVRRLRSPIFAAAYASARLVCPDGLPILLYGRLRGLKLRGRVTGCDVFARLLRHRELRRHRLFLIVESQATASAASKWARLLSPCGEIEIAVAPPSLATDVIAQEALAECVRRAAPTILVITLGAPVSENFVHQNRPLLPPCWALCVGQALRVELALARRAPSLWQALGLEWLWRVVHEPRRLLGRYAQALLWFPVAIWRDLHVHGGPQGG